MGIDRDLAGPFVGRSRELERLEALRRDSSRYGRLVLIAGEAGIGKSRLVKEFLRQAPRGRAAIGVGRALEHVRSPFAPWVSALEQVVPSAAERTLLAQKAFDDKAAMYFAAVEELRECARRRSTILVLEDLQWADAGSLDLLEVLLWQIQSLQRLLVVATVRSSEAHQTLDRISTNAHAYVLELRALPTRECMELVRSLVAADDLEAGRVERIAALSGGNPFFARELSKSTTPDEIPLTLRSAIEARIAGLDVSDVRALEAAAVLGEYFELSLLADLLGCSVAEIAKRLEGAQRAGIVEEDTQRAGLRFAHALTRAAILARLTSAARIDYHQHAARVLEQRGRFDAIGFAQLAYHHAGAHQRDKAYAYNMRAGGLAYNVHAYTDGAQFFADAAACAQPGSLERAAALARQGDALLRTSLIEQAERVYVEAIAIYRGAGSLEEAARLYQSLARSLYNQDRTRDAVAVVERATNELQPLPQHLDDELSLQAAFYGAELGPDVGMSWLRRVDETAVCATRSGGHYYAIRGSILATEGKAGAWRETVAAFQENVTTVGADGSYVGHFGNLAAGALFLGLPAMELYEQCFALARTLKMEVYEAAFASHAAFERWLHGDDEEFARYAAFASARDVVGIPALHSYVMLAAMLSDSNALVSTREVESLIAGGRNEFFGPLAGVFTRRLMRKGEQRAARRILDAASERMTLPYAAWEALTAMAEFGSESASQKAATLLEPHEQSSAPAFAATAAMVRALCAQRAGDVVERDRASARARELYAQMGWVRHERMAGELGVSRTQPVLSDRETQIARLLREGRSNRAMAAQLFISEKTVEKHLARLYGKLQVNNRAAAVHALTQLPVQE